MEAVTEHHIPAEGLEFSEGPIAMPAIEIELPESCVAEAGPVADYPLLTEEAPAVARAIPKRRHQFASGRHFARKALKKLAELSPPIPRDARGRPVWPPGFIGSISHSETLAAAAVSSGPLRGIGIDVEDSQRLARSRPRLHSKLFTRAERGRTLSDPRTGAVTFSAKEAAYKAINPLVGRYIGFREVEIVIEWSRSAFRVRYLGEHEPNRLLEKGYGRFCFCEGQVVTLFFID